MNIKKIIFLFVVFGVSHVAHASSCSVELEGNDAMKFNKDTFAISKSCKEFTVNLKHVGQLAKTVMGHNVVIAKTADLQAIATEGIALGVDQSYVKQSDPRVIAFTKVVSGGESTSVTFPVSKLDQKESYSFFCTFPGHFAMMKGTITFN